MHLCAWFNAPFPPYHHPAGISTMPVFLYRQLEPPSAAAAGFTQWIDNLDRQFAQHASYEERSCIVRDELRHIYAAQVDDISPDAQSSPLELSFDPRHVTLEPEYYGD